MKLLESGEVASDEESDTNCMPSLEDTIDMEHVVVGQTFVVKFKKTKMSCNVRTTSSHARGERERSRGVSKGVKSGGEVLYYRRETAPVQRRRSSTRACASTKLDQGKLENRDY